MNQHLRIPCINRYGELTMSLLEKQIILKGLKGKQTVTAMFDSGASYSCIRRSIAEDVLYDKKMHRLRI